MHQMRPVSGSFGRTDANNQSKWDRVLQYPPRSGQVVSFGYQGPLNRFKDANVNVGPSPVSQTAADEVSRTWIKGSGVLSSMNVAAAMSERQPAGVLIRSGKHKSGVIIFEPESSTMPS